VLGQLIFLARSDHGLWFHIVESAALSRETAEHRFSILWSNGRPPVDHVWQKVHRRLLVRRMCNLLSVPIQDRAEQLPPLAGKVHHLYLLDRVKIRRGRLYSNAWNY
jgi:hypothetical protein